MDGTVAIIILAVFGIPIAFAIWVIVKLIRTGGQIDELSRRINTLESETLRLRELHARQSAPAPQPQAVAKTETVKPAPAPAPPPEPTTFQEPIVPPVSAPVIRPPIPQTPPVFDEPSRSHQQATPSSGLPPPINPAPVPSYQPTPKINWEQFMGVKGFAWVGGFALFLGVTFFIKYAFDNNLIPPAVRVAIGFLAGIGLLVGGVVMSRRNFPALSQTLCATGVVILYAVTFACHSIYHFQSFGLLPTFLVMALITTTAFLLAVRLDALVVAILGMLGGFLTPLLLSTGQDNPGGLFGYIAFLDAGLIVVAFNKRWHFLIALAALGTAVMQIGWASEFFVSQQYFAGNHILVAFAALLGFNVLWLAAQAWSKRSGQINHWLSGSALGLVAVAFVFNWWFLSFPSLAARPWLIFGFIFIVDPVAIALALLDETVSIAQTISGLAVFALLGIWTQVSLSKDLLTPALVFYFAFAVLHSALPAMLQRRGDGIRVQKWGTHLFPIFALALVLVPVFRFQELSFIV